MRVQTDTGCVRDGAHPLDRSHRNETLERVSARRCRRVDNDARAWRARSSVSKRKRAEHPQRQPERVAESERQWIPPMSGCIGPRAVARMFRRVSAGACLFSRDGRACCPLVVRDGLRTVAAEAGATVGRHGWERVRPGASAHLLVPAMPCAPQVMLESLYTPAALLLGPSVSPIGRRLQQSRYETL